MIGTAVAVLEHVTSLAGWLAGPAGILKNPLSQAHHNSYRHSIREQITRPDDQNYMQGRRAACYSGHNRKRRYYAVIHSVNQSGRSVV